MKWGERMFIWTTLLFALSSNVDNLTIAMAYRLHGLRIGRGANLLISFVTGCCTWLSMEAGSSAAHHYLSETAAAYLGAALLIAVGLWFMLDELFKHHRSWKSRTSHYMRCLAPYFWMRTVQEQTVSLHEMFILALLLSVNNLGSGIGASMLGIPPLGTAILVSLFSLLSIFLGQCVGASPFTVRFSKIMPYLAGGILIALGLYEIASRLLIG